MTGGLYRSTNAGHRDGSPRGDVPPLISVDPSAVGPASAGSASADPAKVRLGVPDADGLAGDGEVPGAEPPAGGSSTATNSIVMAVGSLVSRGTGFLRSVVLGSALGAFAVGNAYTTAQIFPSMIYDFLLGGILTSVVLPMLVRRRKAEPDQGEAYTQRLLSLAVLALAGAVAVAMAAASLLTMLYASDATSVAYRDLVTTLSYLMLPMIFFTGLAALFGAVLNTRGHFAAPMWSPILNNLVVIATGGLYIGLFGVGLVSPEQMTPARIGVLGGGTLLGVVVQTIGLVPALRKVGFRWKWRFDFRALGLGELGRLGAWMFCYVAVNQLGLVVLFNLLNRAGERDEAGPLIYNFVFLLLMMAHGIFAVSIITALMPRMSAAADDGRFADIAADLSRGMRTSAAALAPIAVCYGVLAAPITVTLFNYGAFDKDSALSASLVLTAAAVALLPLSISQLFTFANYAMSETRTAALINVPVVAVRIAGQLALFLWLDPRFAAAGLMLGNAISYVVSAIVSATVLRRRVGRVGLRTVALTAGKVTIAALGAALIGLLVVNLLPGGSEPDRLAAIVQLIVGGAAIGGTYLGLAMLLRIREVTQVLAVIRRRVAR